MDIQQQNYLFKMQYNVGTFFSSNLSEIRANARLTIEA